MYDRIAQASNRSGANDLSDGVICNIAISANETTFYCTKDQRSHLWHQLGLVFELESDL